MLLIVATLSLLTVDHVNTELSALSSVSSCSNSQMQAAWMSNADPVTSCQPRPTIISLSEAASGLGHSLSAPTHVEVARCGGSCPQSHSSMLSCVPAKVTSKMVPVMVTPVTVTSGVQEDVCTSIRVEIHESCKCGCEVTPMDCNPKQVNYILFMIRSKLSFHVVQVYVPHRCACECDHSRKAECVVRGWDWDPRLCQCSCPSHGLPYPACPTGYIFDYLEECKCVDFHLKGGGWKEEVAFVIVLLGFVTLIVSLAQCYRRHVGLFKHLRPGPGKLNDVIETLNIAEHQGSIKRSRIVSEDLKTIEEENIELLNVKREDET